MGLISNSEMKWIVLHGKDVSDENKVLLSQAVDIFHGYFQLFFNCFEKLLAYLKVKKMVVLAAEDVESMWIQKFGFEKVTQLRIDINCSISRNMFVRKGGVGASRWSHFSRWFPFQSFLCRSKLRNE
ncbi:unnamed protein product [Lactuca virosa]|uniref:Increased DNA methylation 1 C-terminal domain-containing protein n=1 Tax=Lactuca virosa TaxID=75947 RepID=A0AAU9MQM2_9ASTR|nr:unnamed protein product [Lactuca virosa]